MKDCEAVQRTMETLNKTTLEFCEADMRRKLKECQGLRTQAYQHIGDYIEGDKVWYQPLNGNSWLGPAAVLCQRGQSVWLHTSGDIKKAAACKVKPYELIDRESEEYKRLIDQESDEYKKNSRKVMLEDGLKDVESLMDPEKEIQRDALKLADVTSDNVGTNYLKIINSVSFFDLSIYTVELSVSEHGRPEVKEAIK